MDLNTFVYSTSETSLSSRKCLMLAALFRLRRLSIELALEELSSPFSFVQIRMQRAIINIYLVNIYIRIYTSNHVNSITK